MVCSAGPTNLPLPRDSQRPRCTFNNPTIQGAYNLCLDHEANFLREETCSIKLCSGLLAVTSARVLGYLVIYAPNDRARNIVATEIVSTNQCTQNSEGCQNFYDLGKFYTDHFIRCSSKGRTPRTSHHQSRQSFALHKDEVKDFLREPPKDHSSAKRTALVRDGYRCLFTGAYETLSDPSIRVYGSRTANTQCAHIFPSSINQGINTNTTKKEYTTTVWTIMDMFGCTAFKDELNGVNINRLGNVMTLCVEAHMEFDKLGLWFEPTDKPDCYKIYMVHPSMDIAPDFDEVEFRVSDEAMQAAREAGVEPPELPKKEYLAMHAACARVAHMSGAGEYVDKIMRDIEEVGVLAEDGTSASLLEYALHEYAMHEISVY